MSSIRYMYGFPVRFICFFYCYRWWFPLRYIDREFLWSLLVKFSIFGFLCGVLYHCLSFSHFSFGHCIAWPSLFVPRQGHYDFHSFPVVDWFCLFIYLRVLTFPLQDCSEFGNFVITLMYGFWLPHMISSNISSY